MLWLSSTNVNVSGGLVDQYNDASPIGAHFPQTGTARAAYTAGPPSLVTYDGSNDCYLYNGLLSGCTGALTFGCVFRHNVVPVGSTAHAYIAKLRTNTAETFDFHTSSGTGYSAFNCAAKTPNGGHTSHSISGGSLNTAWRAVLIHYNGLTPTTNTNYVTSVDGVTSSNPGNNSGPCFGTANVTTGIGAYYVSGAVAAGTQLNGVIKELVVFNYGMYDDNRSEFANFNRWLNAAARTAF